MNTENTVATVTKVTRWKRQEKDTGLMRVIQGERHWQLIQTCGENKKTLVFTSFKKRVDVTAFQEREYVFRINLPEGERVSKASFGTLQECKEAADIWYKANKQRFVFE